MVDALKETASKAVMGTKRMALQMWCVLAIGGIEYMHSVGKPESSYVTLVAILMIAALGGVDAWKQGMLDKITPGKQIP